MDRTEEREKLTKHYFNRALDGLIPSLESDFQDRVEKYVDDDQEDVTLLQCGLILAGLSRLARLAGLNGGREEKTREAVFLLREKINKEFTHKPADPLVLRKDIFRLRFLAACAQLDQSSVSTVKEMASPFTAGGAVQPLRGKITPSLRDRRTPHLLIYEHLLLLTELWQGLQDEKAGEELERYLDQELHNRKYVDLCKCHRFIGFFSLFSSANDSSGSEYSTFGDVGRDILLQHLFRNNYLRSALKNDSYRFFEQVFLSLSADQNGHLLHFLEHLLKKKIENYFHTSRFFTAEQHAEEKLRLTSILLDYFNCVSSGEQQKVDKESTDSFKLDSKHVVKAVNAKVSSGESEDLTFSRSAYIRAQLIEESLYIMPDGNWSKKYVATRDDIPKAIKQGASAVLTSRDVHENLNATYDSSIFQVKNSFAAMLKLAMANRGFYEGKVIGVTGSVGKTTSVAMLDHLLASCGKSYRNIAFFNHQVGVPKSVINIPQESDFAIIEMGMGMVQTILPKTMLARPHVALLTDIQHDHMEFHETIGSIIETKMEIIEGVEPGGKIVLNRDSTYFEELMGYTGVRGDVEVVTFGEHPLADIRARHIDLQGDHSHIEIVCGEQLHSYRLSLPGKHMALNSLGVCAVLHCLGLNLQQALPAFASLTPDPGRNEMFWAMLEGKKIRVIDDSFNANPASMRASFHLLSLVQPELGGRRIMVLGDMAELGEKGQEYQTSLAEDINNSTIDVVYSIGPLNKKLDSALSDSIEHAHFHSPSELQKKIISELHHGDVICVKGSARENAMGKVIRFLQGKKIETDNQGE